MIETLWNLAIDLINTSGDVWTWLNTDFEIKLFTFDILTAKPIEMIGGSFLITLIGFAIIKTFVPGA